MSSFTLSPSGDSLLRLLAAGVLTGIVLLVHRIASQGPQLAKFPLLGEEYGSRRKRIEAFMYQPAQLYQDGYRRFKDQIYRLTMPDGDHLIVPNRYLDELRQHPDDEIDVLKSFEDVRPPQKYTCEKRTEVANSVVKVDLTRNLTRLNPRLSEEVNKTVNAELPPCADWTSVPVFPVLLRIVAIVSGNIFVGPDLCRHEVYLASAIEYTKEVTTAAQEIKKWPKWLRSAVAYLELSPALKRSQEHRRRMKAFLEPIFQDRRQMMRNGQPVPEDLLQWMVEKTMEHEINNIEHITDMQLLLTMAAIHTTTLSATAMLYDLAMRPEVVHDIRKEIASVLETTDGVMTSHALFSMKLLDSFMRESQRFTPPFVDSFRRYVQKPITLQDGTQIPAGTFIETPSLAVLHDAAHYKDPEVFDAYRFFNLRTKDDTPDPNGFRNREQYQFVSVTKENTSFGFGKHACPGRFFAANEIKLIMARIVLQFDLRFPADVKERYPNFHFGSVSGPSPTGLVEFKRVQE
ncbi:cytochrome P450 [Cryphonectria parasitica EP155]|uniref:Cytochrome P450 n=1 Tax=Cryphonectria parasitica (strain ATCC 38755 / EP155) TaxID=660469 RepID=A0A9P5CPR0_CRYP1|nr:cytochrome P450 [Cryphonectria parasitica EP155]KAF3766428.1 cytochrome P450 [Cryphonectria parasitica EP155]